MRRSAVFVGVLLMAALASVCRAQDTGDRGDYQNVNNNARSGRVAARAPGNVVSAGLARARAFITRGQEGTQIDRDASSVPLSPWAQARIESLQILFTNLNLMINALHNTIRAQAGLDPVPPRVPNFPDVGGGSTDGGDLGGGFDLGDLGGLLDDFGLTSSSSSAKSIGTSRSMESARSGKVIKRSKPSRVSKALKPVKPRHRRGT
ncbi:MAG: hypothetical protein IT449_14905 [Phycisphaerales bacterium]|nr:hypothetical protein [Phycisphaerales bacterium]